MKNSWHGLAGVCAAYSLVASLFLELGYAPQAMAQEAPSPSSSCIDWSKLNLSGQQNSQIQALEQQWFKEFNEISPQLRDDRTRLQRAISDHNADPVQIMALQQSVARRKEQLSNAAMQNYLCKKKVLNDAQQKQLEEMIRREVLARKQQLYPGTNGSPEPDRLQNLMQRIWPVNDK
jgi:Spy/CpxP family protein refolding chaperone